MTREAMVKGRSPAPDHIIFIHVPKAAGRTISSIAVRQYGPREVLQVGGGIGEASVSESLRGIPFKVVLGHVHYGLHTRLQGTSTYITMLRDPIDRVLSLFRYISSNPNHPLHERTAGVDLRTFASGSIDAEEVENGQTRQIAGVTSGSPDRDDLMAAKRNLAEFIAFGIVERFDESIMLFRRRLGWAMPYYVRKNVTEARVSGEHDPEVLALIQARNMLDAELYRYACDLFEERLRLEGPLFAFELLTFQVLNSIARVYHGLRG